MKTDHGLSFAEAKCPFCGGGFSLPEGKNYYNEQISSCGCGARFELEDQDEVGMTTREIREEAEDGGQSIEIRFIPRIDYLSVDGVDPAVWDGVTAIFWKPTSS